MKLAIDVYEIAMGIIANAHDGNWNEASKEWRDAAKRFRDEYHAELDIHVRDERIKELESELVKLRSTSDARKATPTERIAFEIVAERKRQDEKWGGAIHDDTHSARDWKFFRRDREDAITHRTSEHDILDRRDLIEIAALAVAQVEVWDRHCKF